MWMWDVLEVSCTKLSMAQGSDAAFPKADTLHAADAISAQDLLSMQLAEMCDSVCAQHCDTVNGSCDGSCA